MDWLRPGLPNSPCRENTKRLSYKSVSEGAFIGMNNVLYMQASVSTS